MTKSIFGFVTASFGAVLFGAAILGGNTGTPAIIAGLALMAGGILSAGIVVTCYKVT
jgi:hypothetical protein